MFMLDLFEPDREIGHGLLNSLLPLGVALRPLVLLSLDLCRGGAWRLGRLLTRHRVLCQWHAGVTRFEVGHDEPACKFQRIRAE